MTSTTATAPVPPAPAAAAPEMSHRQILEVMTGILAALFTAMLATTIVTTALPTIMADLKGTQRQYTWVITASLLAMTVSTPIWGKLSDLFNKKLLIQIAIVVFVAGSAGAGISQTVPPMMIFRAVQGLGMGGLMALAQSIIGAIIPPRQRGRYSGYMGATMAVSTVSGPLLGGVITDHLSWRWCFYVTIPLAVLAMYLLQKTLRLPVRKREVKIDYLGAALIAVAAALPMLWVTFAGQDYAWVSWQSAAFLVGFVVAAVLVVLVELRVPEPMVPIRVLRNSTTALMILASLGVGTSMFASSTFLTQYFQLAGGHSPTRAGLMTIPLIVAQMLASTLGGLLVTRTGRWKPVMVFGAFVLLAGLAGLGTIDHTTPYWIVAIYMALMGIGVGALIQNIVLAVQNTVDVSQVGASSATISFFRSLGGAVGVAVLGAVLADHVETGVADGLRAARIPAQAGGGAGGNLDLQDLPGPIQAIVRTAYGDAFGLLFLIAAAVSVLTLITVLVVREVPLRTTLELKPQSVAAEETQTDPSAVTPAVLTGQEPPTAPSLEPEAQLPRDEEQPENQTSATHLSHGRAGSADGHDAGELGNHQEQRALAALDVLATAQNRARDQVAASRQHVAAAAGLVEQAGRDADSAVARFHAELDQIKSRLRDADHQAGDGIVARHAGLAGDRGEEYGLLLAAQQTADHVMRVARTEAERVLTEADTEAAALQRRIAEFQRRERELSERAIGR